MAPVSFGPPFLMACCSQLFFILHNGNNKNNKTLLNDSESLQRFERTDNTSDSNVFKGFGWRSFPTTKKSNLTQKQHLENFTFHSNNYTEEGEKERNSRMKKEMDINKLDLHIEISNNDESTTDKKVGKHVVRENEKPIMRKNIHGINGFRKSDNIHSIFVIRNGVKEELTGSTPRKLNNMSERNLENINSRIIQVSLLGKEK
ncbi:unnamed protein product [Meganyctiphanes norvegica]|uniref:Uncharacterized protein n=1 Tax=Meganyctiphanes norvegica TaxID=48144 RepID=A0AAV2SC93_MEGNR